MNTAIAHRTDAVPATHLRGFDPDQNVFLYDQAVTPTQEAALFFPLDSYYPDAPEAQDVPLARLNSVFAAYDTYVDSLGEADEDRSHPAVVEYEQVVKQLRANHYFSTARSLLDQLLDGQAPDFVFANNAPEVDDADRFADYKAAFFDATGLVAIAHQLDMPRMAAAGGFHAFKHDASPAQFQTMDRFSSPERFDSLGQPKA